MKSYKPKTNDLAKKFTRHTGRDTRQDKGYNKEWYAYRARFLKHNPKCYICGDTATVIDHILRARGNMEYFDNPGNHLSNCASCHGRVTQMFDRGEVQDLDGKIKYIIKARKINRIDIAIKVIPYKKR